jgi:hypothetical protein
MNIYRKIINTKPRYPDGFDSRLKSLSKHLLRRDLSKRFGNLKDGAKDLKDHRFFEEINFDDLLSKKLNPPHIPKVTELKMNETNWAKDKLIGSVAVSGAEDPFSDW